MLLGLAVGPLVRTLDDQALAQARAAVALAPADQDAVLTDMQNNIATGSFTTERSYDTFMGTTTGSFSGTISSPVASNP